MASGPDDTVRNSMSGSAGGPVVQAGEIRGDLTLHHGSIEPRTVRWLALGGLGLALTVVGLVFFVGLAVLGLAVLGLAVWELFRPPVGARELAALVKRAERPALNQLLGDHAAPPVADTPFSQPPIALVTWRTNGGEQDGSLRDIAGYYQRLGLKRLLVIGEPGAGKTVLLLQLVLDLVECGFERVPVRLSLPTFDPVPGNPEDIAEQLDRWIAEQLHTSYGLSRRHAKNLVRNDHVLPVLDGLDEMDPDDAEPTRAAAVVRAFNLLPEPVVLACRSTRFDQLGEPLQDSTVIAVRPLSPELVADYLTARFPNMPDRLQPLLNRLRQPRSGDALVTALRSPLRLYLAVTAYQDCDLDDLLALAKTEAIDRHLFDRFVPAVTAADPRYPTADVHRWLVNLARVLDDNARRGRSGSDLELTDVWRVAHRWLPRVLGLLPALLIVVVLALLVYEVTGDAAGTALISVLFLGPVGLGAARSHAVSEQKTRQQLVVVWLVVAAVGLGLSSFVFYLGARIDSATGLAFILLATMSAFVLREPSSVMSRPIRLVRRALRAELIALSVGFAMGVAGLTALRGEYAGYAVFSGLVAVLVVAAETPWLRFGSGIVLAASRGALPWRPARFLDWALDAGLLRMSGTALQFRHREFQRHLLRGDTDDSAPPRKNS